MFQAVECLPSKHKALSSNSGKAKEKKILSWTFVISHILNKDVKFG
jgi:hypothetical protein